MKMDTKKTVMIVMPDTGSTPALTPAPSLSDTLQSDSRLGSTRSLLLGFSEAGLLMVGADNFEFSVAEPQKQIPITWHGWDGHLTISAEAGTH